MTFLRENKLGEKKIRETHSSILLTTHPKIIILEYNSSTIVIFWFMVMLAHSCFPIVYLTAMIGGHHAKDTFCLNLDILRFL